MDPFTFIVAGGLGALIVVLVLIGLYYPGSGADVLDWKPTRSPEVDAQNEIDDVQQMIDAQNAMRRRRGAPERNEEQIELEVMRHQQEMRDYTARFWADQRAKGIEPPDET